MTRTDRPSLPWIATAITVLSVFVVSVLAPFLRAPHTDSDAVLSGPNEAGATAPLVVIGFSGVTWDSVDPDLTPNLYSLIDAGASANLVVKTFGITTCPNAGWLTLHFGVRAVDLYDSACSPILDTRQDGSVYEAVASEINARQEDSAYGVPNQILGTLLGDRSVATVGGGSVLAMLGATESSRQHVDLSYDAGIGTDVGDAYDLVAGTDVVVLDLGRVRQDGTDEVSSPISAAFSGPQEMSDKALTRISELDAQLGDVLSRIPQGTNVMVLSVADADSTTARLQLFSVQGPAAQAGTEAYSNSTRHSGLVQLTDVPQTILHLVGTDPADDFVGSTIQLTGGEPARLSAFDDVQERALSVRPAVGPFYVMAGLLSFAFIAYAVAAFQRGRAGEQPARLGHRATTLGLVAAAIPASSFLANLVPWWRVGASTVAFLVLVLIIASLIALGARAIASRLSGVDGVGGWFAAVAVVAAVTALTIGVDAIVGSSLHASSVLGDQPQSGGRFYGLSNAPFTLFAIAMIVVTAYAIRILKTYRGVIAVPAAIVAMGISAAVIDGAPSIGADFGGPPAIVIAFLVMLFLALGKTFTGKTVALIGTAGAGIAMVIAFADWLRPEESRTHLGNFFQDVVNGEFFAVVGRKLGLLWTSVPWFAWILAVLFAGAVYLWWKRGGRPDFDTEHGEEFRWAAIAIVVLCLVGLVINDSGLVIPLFGIVFGAPLVIAASQRYRDSVLGYRDRR